MSLRNSRTDNERKQLYKASGTNTPWYQGWELTDEEREVYRKRSIASQRAKLKSLSGEGRQPIHSVNTPRLRPELLMPRTEQHGLRSLSMFSGGGGLDLGFDLAGFTHVASYEILSFAGNTIRKNRPDWKVYSGEEGDVTQINWRKYRGEVDVVHGGPPCQPFSTAGRQLGRVDARDMFPEFVRAVLEIKPRAFLVENVPGLAQSKFERYLKHTVLNPLSKEYSIKVFLLDAASFGVPQRRTRIIFVGFRKDEDLLARYVKPRQPYEWRHLLGDTNYLNENRQLEMFSKFDSVRIKQCVGAREALGLPDIGYDTLVPTLRSGLTGPRHTTSILSSKGAMQIWSKLEIWPHGVSLDRTRAANFPPENGHFRLSVQDCAVLQGFPEPWCFEGPVYKAIGQIGNSVVPPMAYELARSIAQTLILRA